MRPTSTLLSLLVSALLVAPTTATPHNPVEQAEPISVLLISGANNHDWEWTTPSLQSMLEESGRFEVSVTYEPAKTLTEPLDGFDVFLLDYNGPRWGETAEQAFLEAVSQGTGVAVVHAANNAFNGWTEYEKLVALMWRRAGEVATGHGKFHAFNVDIVDRNHPITADLPTLRRHPDELYHRLIPMHEAPYRVLATAFSDPETGGTGQDEPMIAVQQYGQGRIFHTPLGHVWKGVAPSKASHADPQLRALIVRGTEWAATGRVLDGRALPNHLTSLERAQGWELLFNGRDLSGWRAYGGEAAPEGWQVTAGCLHRAARAGDLISEKEFEDFELRFEWKLARGSNSGVKIRVNEQADRPAAIGPEYQLLDDSAFPDLPANQRAASFYDLVAASEEKPLRHLTQFNQSRILARGGRIEHWLNGVRVLSADMSSDEFAERLAASKFAEVEGFGRGLGGIVLQDHGDEVFFRSIAIRPLLPRDQMRSLLADDLDGWKDVGDAIYTREGDAIRGKVGGGGQSFLMSEETFGDFIFEVDLKLEDRGNSGIQIRSHQRDNGRVFGYQIEIDPSDRAWSGGLFDEARRGWLDNLLDDPDARAAFRLDGWNHYRIECFGPWVRTWVNGVPAADHFDPMDLEGFLALQVHSGKNAHVIWKDPRILSLGERSWVPIQAQIQGGWQSTPDGWIASEGGSLQLELPHEFCLKLRLSTENAEGLRLEWNRKKGGSLPADRDLLWTSPTSRGLEFSKLPGLADSKLHEVTVASYGHRVAVHLDGKLVLDQLQHPFGLEGDTVLSATGQAHLHSIERVSEPAR